MSLKKQKDADKKYSIGEDWTPGATYLGGHCVASVLTLINGIVAVDRTTKIADVWLADNRYCTTLCPPEMNECDLVEAIAEAYSTGAYKVLRCQGVERRYGKCKRGFEIAMEIRDGDMETAYPVTRRK